MCTCLYFENKNMKTLAETQATISNSILQDWVRRRKKTCAHAYTLKGKQTENTSAKTQTTISTRIRKDWVRRHRHWKSWRVQKELWKNISTRLYFEGKQNWKPRKPGQKKNRVFSPFFWKTPLKKELLRAMLHSYLLWKSRLIGKCGSVGFRI